MNRIKIWLHAFRLRTLPLALSSTFVGSFLAFPEGKFKWAVFLLVALTTLFLQILSNLANDYGDAVKGTDNKNRTGPIRGMQSGTITKKNMKKMIMIFVGLSLCSGIALILTSLSEVSLSVSVLFFIVGIGAIAAAIKYTIGKKPFGYSGFGDVFVFLFFGLTGVLGTYFLHTLQFSLWVLLPASTIGLLSVGVLNLNNMRDIKNDKACGKKTLVVRMGLPAAKIYHAILIIGAIVLALIYSLNESSSYFRFLYLLTLPLFFRNLYVVFIKSSTNRLNDQLKWLSLSTFAFTICFSIGLIM